VPASAIVYDNAELFIPKKMDASQTLEILRTGLGTITSVETFDAPSLEAAFRADTERAGVKVGPWLQPFRVALTGKTVAPPLFESMVVLGREETILRVQNAMRALETAVIQRA
jgi:glutamyl-tRNA synthetase